MDQNPQILERWCLLTIRPPTPMCEKSTIKPDSPSFKPKSFLICCLKSRWSCYLLEQYLLNNNQVNFHHRISTGTGEGESNDRDTLELPGHQADLLRDAATYSKYIVQSYEGVAPVMNQNRPPFYPALSKFLVPIHES